MIQYRRDFPKLMKALNLPMIAAELGVAEGNYSNELITNGIEKLYMVDAWRTLTNQTGDGTNIQEWHNKNYHDALRQNAVHIEQDKAVILRGISWEMAVHVPDNSLGLLYMDCCHSYECIRRDVGAWFSKVVKGGIIATHDYHSSNYGTRQFFEEFCFNRYEIFIIDEDKPEDAGAMFRI